VFGLWWKNSDVSREWLGYPEQGACQMMNEQIWNAWQRDWEWMVDAIKQKGYDASLRIAPPAAAAALESLAREYWLVLPVEFTEVLTRFSARVQLEWHIGEPLAVWRPPDVPEPSNWTMYSGAGVLWDAEALFFLWQPYEAYVEPYVERFEEIEADDLVKNKTPFVAVGNGDFLAFDVAHGNRNCPVVYMDHEWGRPDGWRLGLDFIDFISRWSNLGCPAPSSLRRFYDAERNLLLDSGQFVENWKRWLSTDPRQGALPLE
jgi:hypothetical protein